MVSQMTPQPRPQPQTKSPSKPVQPMKTHTLQGELHQILAYTSATNTRISYLSSYLTTLPHLSSPFKSPSSADGITKVKLGLKDAHRGLEKLELECRGTMGREVKKVTTEVWRCYVRCRVLEEGIRELRERRPGGDGEIGEMKEVEGDGDEEMGEKKSGNAVIMDKDVVIGKAEREQVVVYVPSGARKGKKKMLRANPEQDRNGEGKEEAQDETERRQTYRISGPLRTSAPSSFVYEDTDGAKTSSNEFAKEPSRMEVKAPNGHDSWNTAEGSTTLNSDTILVVGRRDSQRTYPLKASPRPRIEILAKINREEARESAALQDPDRVRQGSTSGGLTTLAIMSGMEDDRYVLPSLDYIKIHEVKSLKKWLVEYGYLRRAGAVSRIERVLHFIFAMQMGCRLETLALLFSRSPRQVESSCKDVLEGILQMHSETELPRSGTWPMYAHLWHMSEKYKACAKDYYPWSRMDFETALVTLNLFIGRYRKQGHLALGGPFLDWGKYMCNGTCNGTGRGGGRLVAKEE